MPGHPVFFGRDFWPALAANLNDQGPGRFADRVIAVPVADPGVIRDIDYPSAIPGPEA